MAKAKRRRLVVNHSPDRSSDFQPESSLDRDTSNPSEPIESDGIGNPLTSVQKFPSINLPSNINVVDFDSARDEFMIPSTYSLIRPEAHHKIYTPITHNGQQAIGISRASFMCGLRLPLHPFVRYVLEDSGIALGQLMPNSFFQINAFIARSRDRGVNLNSHLFWHHYHVSLSPKCPGCYIFARRPGKQQWTGTNSNNRGCHEEWFFVSGPGLENVSQWTTDPPRIESELDDVHLKLYKQLTSKHHSLLRWSPAQLRDEQFLLLYRVSSRDADLKEVERRRRLQNKAKLEKLALKKRQRLQPEASDSMVIVTPTQTHSGSTPAQSPHPTVTTVDRAKVIAPHDPPDPKRSKSSPIMELPDELTEQASAASKAFSRSLLASIPMTEDHAKKFSLGSVRSSGQTVAFISQALLWAGAQDAQAASDEEILMKALADAETHESKFKEAEAARLSFEKQVTELEREITQLNKQLKLAQKETAAAQEEKFEAQTKWYDLGMHKRLLKAKEVGLDYKLMLDEYEPDPFELEEAENAEHGSDQQPQGDAEEHSGEN